MNSNKRPMKNRKPKRNPVLWIILLCLIVVISVVLLIVSIGEKKADGNISTDTTSETEKITESPVTEKTEVQTTQEPEATPTSDWKLLLVNSRHPMPEGYTANIVEFSEGKYVDSRIVEPLTKLIDAAKADGYNIVVRSGYRSYDEQMQLYNQRLERLIEEGMSRENAEVEILKWVAYPGTSEHQTGLACDMNGDRVVTSDDQAYEWLIANAYKYGFIYRFPENKTEITGVTNEPWHIRYVGEEAATEITEKGICLEEYLGMTE